MLKLTGRQACEATPAWNLTKTLAQTAVFWAVFLLGLPTLIYHVESMAGLHAWRFPGVVSQTAGCVLFVLGGSLGITCGTIMALVGRGTPFPLDSVRELVVAGPYRYVRNPMAIAGLAQGVGVGLFLGSPAVVLYALAGGPVWNCLVRPAEERELEERFGDGFRAYQRAVLCWIPRWTPYEPSSSPAREPGRA